MTNPATPHGGEAADVSDSGKPPSPSAEVPAHGSDGHRLGGAPTRPSTHDTDRADPVLEGRLHELIEELEEEPDEPASKAQLKNIAIMIASVEETFTGPVPHPRLMREYDSVIHNGAERIMLLTEREQAYRHEITRAEQKVMDRAEQNDYSLARRGQTFGFAVCVLFSALAVWLIAIGHTIPAALILLGDLAAVVTVFVTGRRRSGSSGKE